MLLYDECIASDLKSVLCAKFPKSSFGNINGLDTCKVQHLANDPRHRAPVAAASILINRGFLVNRRNVIPEVALTLLDIVDLTAG